jgi:hypothetical protein
MSGWLDDWTNWVGAKVDQVVGVVDGWIQAAFDYWDALYRDWTQWVVDLVNEAIYATLEALLKFAVAVLREMPAPEFLTSTSMGEILGRAGPTVAWLSGVMNVGECFAIIAAGFVFRIFRKLMTMGRW